MSATTSAPSAPSPATGPAVAALLFNAFVWGVSWLPFRWLSERGLHSLWATAAIYGVAWLLIVARAPRTAVGALAQPPLLMLGLAAGVTNACFNWGVATGEVVRVVLLFYLMPIWAVLLARLLLGEPLRWRSLLLVGLAIGGAAIVLWQPGMGLPWPASRADWLGVIGGMGFALTNVLLRRQAGDSAIGRASVMFAGGTVLPASLALLMAAIGWDVGAPDLARSALAGLGVIALMFVLANLALQYGAARLPTRVTAVVMLSEVVFAAVSAVMLGGEALTLRMLVGAALILGASLLSALGPR